MNMKQLRDPQLNDLGWDHPPARTIMDGMSNDDIHILIRRFNKQLFHVKSIQNDTHKSNHSSHPDLEYSPLQESSPDKWRATLERLYMTVVVGIAAFGKHIARLRSWNEPQRTASFCIAYYAAWLSNSILPLLLSVLLTLTLIPDSRPLLFPPAPLAIINATTGNLQTPKAGVLGSDDTLSGAPEKHPGEAVEQEARHFVSGFAAIAVSTAAGKGPGEDGNGNAIGGGDGEAQGLDKHTPSIDGSVPDPVGVVLGGTQAKDLASGDDSTKDPAKDSVHDAMWDKARPIMQTLDDIADSWERWCNALSPTPPFPTFAPRIRIALPLVLLVLVTSTVRAVVFLRFFTFLLGFVFFGQPVLSKWAHVLAHKVPRWRRYFELKRTLLLGVPTNAQLALALLRIGEAHNAPLPPPPSSLDALPAQDLNSDSELDFDISNYPADPDCNSDVEGVDLTSTEESEASTAQDQGEKTPKPGRRVAGFLKRSAKVGVGGALGVDYLKATVGFEHAKRRLGVVSHKPPADLKDAVASAAAVPGSDVDPGKKFTESEGPSVFSARLHGRKGYAVLVTSATSPCISFVFEKPRFDRKIYNAIPGTRPKLAASDVYPEFAVAVSDIIGLRKVGGFGWKGKMVVGWALGREILDGLEITNKEGRKITLTAIKGRNELFNRLIAMGSQRWECW